MSDTAKDDQPYPAPARPSRTDVGKAWFPILRQDLADAAAKARAEEDRRRWPLAHIDRSER